MNEGTIVYYVYPCCSVHGTEVDLNVGCQKCGYNHLEVRTARMAYSADQISNVTNAFRNEEDAKVAKANLLIKINSKKK